MKTEDKLNDANSEMNRHERVLFSRPSVRAADVKVLNIHKRLYANCPDFSLLYRFLLDKRDHGTAETLVPRPDSTASTDDPLQAKALSRPTKKRKGENTNTGLKSYLLPIQDDQTVQIC